MQNIKKMVRKNERPLEQLHNRMEETRMFSARNLPGSQIGNTFHSAHASGPLLTGLEDPQYKRIKSQECTFDSTDRNNCCGLLGTKVILIENFATSQDTGELHVIGREFECLEELYTYPCESSILGIFRVSKLKSKLESWPISDITDKYFRLPFHDSYAVFPLLHVSW